MRLHRMSSSASILFLSQWLIVLFSPDLNQQQLFDSTSALLSHCFPSLPVREIMCSPNTTKPKNFLLSLVCFQFLWWRPSASTERNSRADVNVSHEVVREASLKKTNWIRKSSENLCNHKSEFREKLSRKSFEEKKSLLVKEKLQQLLPGSLPIK